jgi:hypothetical protein
MEDEGEQSVLLLQLRPLCVQSGVVMQEDDLIHLPLLAETFEFVVLTTLMPANTALN